MPVPRNDAAIPPNSSGLLLESPRSLRGRTCLYLDCDGRGAAGVAGSTANCVALLHRDLRPSPKLRGRRIYLCMEDSRHGGLDVLDLDE